MEISWWSVDFKTGARGSQVFVQQTGKLARIISVATDTTLKVRCSQDQGSIEPVIVTNHVFNPSSNNGSTSFWGSYGTGTSLASVVADGRRAFQVTKPTGSGQQGASTTGIESFPEGTVVTGSVEVKWQNHDGTPKPVTLIFRDDANNDSVVLVNPTAGAITQTVPDDGDWHRIFVTGSVKPGRNLERYYVSCSSLVVGSDDALLFRDAMLNEGELVNAFAGDTLGARWNGTAYASTSSKLAGTTSVDGPTEIPGWDEATTKGRSLLVAVDKDGDQIIWGGLVRRRDGEITEPWVDVSLDTLEAYLARRYIKTPMTWNNADAAQIAADVVTAQITGLPPLQVDAKMTGTTLNGFYDDSDNKRVGDVLRDLSGLDNGIEFTVDLEWADAAHTQMRYVVRIAPRLGTPGGIAATQWTMPGCITGGRFIEDFGEQTGANDILALSSGEGDSKPRSTPYEDTLLLASYARFEFRDTPAASITATSTLDQYAEAWLAEKRLGLSQLTIIANLDAAPQVNRDWWLGDDIDVSVTSPRFPRRKGADGFWEPGYTRRLRTVGWEIDLAARTITPRIKEAA